MTTGLSDRLRNTRRAALIGVGITVAAFQLSGSLGIRINTSPSLPMGLYIITADATANLVEFCPVEPFATLSRVRGYRAPGACGDGADPLLKPIVAKAGDSVVVSALGISVNGMLLHNTAPLSADTKGRHLEAWPFGHYVVAPGTIWVASSYHPGSFDSRYFGPVATAAIRHRLKAFLTL
jgi:conjugative transfer signal peptidase TraF